MPSNQIKVGCVIAILSSRAKLKGRPWSQSVIMATKMIEPHDMWYGNLSKVVLLHV